MIRADQLVVRAYDHALMKRVCDALTKPSEEENRTSLPRSPPHDLLVSVASAFVQLQQARRTVDYDLSVDVVPSYAAERVAMAAQALREFAVVRELPQIRLLLAALLVGDRLRPRG